MTAKDIQARIAAMATHVTFRYAGKECGVDPLSPTHFDMWCGDDAITVDSIGAVMDTPFFLGRALQDITPDITDIDY